MSYFAQLVAEKKARQARFEAAALRLVAPVIVPEPEPIPEPVVEEPTPDEFAEWRARHRRLWFSIVPDGAATPPTYTLREIRGAVCHHFDITVMDLISERRTRNLTIPRQISFYLCKTLTLRSLPDIGRFHGDKDHTTVLYGVRKITALCKVNHQWRDIVEEIRIKITGQSNEAVSGIENTQNDGSYPEDAPQFPQAQEAAGEVACPSSCATVEG